MSERGQKRRRLRELLREREALLLDLGALVYELHRQGKRAPELLQPKAAELTVIDDEVRALDAALAGLAPPEPPADATTRADRRPVDERRTRMALRGRGAAREPERGEAERPGRTRGAARVISCPQLRRARRARPARLPRVRHPPGAARSEPASRGAASTTCLRSRPVAVVVLGAGAFGFALERADRRLQGRLAAARPGQPSPAASPGAPQTETETGATHHAEPPQPAAGVARGPHRLHGRAVTTGDRRRRAPGRGGGRAVGARGRAARLRRLRPRHDLWIVFAGRFDSQRAPSARPPASTARYPGAYATLVRPAS